MNFSKKKWVKDVTPYKIYCIIEKNNDIKLKNKTEYYCRNINSLEFLIELGKKLYKITCGLVLLENLSKHAVRISEIETIVSITKEPINDMLYERWIQWYNDNNIELRYFKKDSYNSYIYIFIALLYLEYGVNYMVKEMQEILTCNLKKAIETYPMTSSNILSCNNIAEKNILNIARLLGINEKFYTINEIRKGLSFNENSCIAYIGIYTCELLTLELVLEKRVIADLQTASYYVGNILNMCSMSAKIPNELYYNLRMNENIISDEFSSMSMLKEGKKFRSYYKVLAIKNLVGNFFISYIKYDNISYLNLCRKLLKKYSNDKMYRPVDCNNTSRSFFYYFSKVNNIEFRETHFKEKGCQYFRLFVQKKHFVDNKMLSFETQKKYSMDVYSEALVQLSNCEMNDNFLLKDELQSYKFTMNDINSVNKSELDILNNEGISRLKKSHAALKAGTNIDFSDKKNTLYILKKTNACQNRNHNVIAVTGILKNLRGFSVKINVNYCENCKKFFINRIDFDEFCKRHGIMLGNFSVKELNFCKGFNGRYKLADESPLHYCGYNVNKQKGLTESDRHKILANIIDFNIMKKTEIIEYLHFYINNIGNRANMNLAVSKWEDDLYFVNNYRINKQKSYRIDKIRQK